MIEATVGSGYYGDIAIDDLTMTSGSCSQGITLKLVFYIGIMRHFIWVYTVCKSTSLGVSVYKRLTLKGPHWYLSRGFVTEEERDRKIICHRNSASKY